MEERKQRWLKGSFTVEMAFLMPMILFQEPHMKRRLREVQR